MVNNINTTNAEAKDGSILSKTEYELILGSFKDIEKISYSDNYFDNKIFTLLSSGHSMHVQVLGNKNIIYFRHKNPENNFDLYKADISRGQYNLLLSHRIIPVSEVKKALKTFEFEENHFLWLKGTITVSRTEIAHKYGKKIRIYLESNFFGQAPVDYEIRVESDVDLNHAKETLEDFMAILKILIHRGKSKYQRIFP